MPGGPSNRIALRGLPPIVLAERLVGEEQVEGLDDLVAHRPEADDVVHRDVDLARVVPHVRRLAGRHHRDDDHERRAARSSRSAGRSPSAPARGSACRSGSGSTSRAGSRRRRRSARARRTASRAAGGGCAHESGRRRPASPARPRSARARRGPCRRPPTAFLHVGAAEPARDRAGPREASRQQPALRQGSPGAPFSADSNTERNQSCTFREGADDPFRAVGVAGVRPSVRE